MNTQRIHPVEEVLPLSTMLGGLFNSLTYNVFTQKTGLIALSNSKNRFVVAAAGGQSWC